MAKSSFSTHLIRNERPSRSTENKHHSMWCPLETFSYFFRKQNAVLRLCCVLTNTRESVIASKVRVHARLSVCTSWYISSWSVYYCFCPCLKASDWQGAEGTRSSAAFSHIQCVGESGRPRQLAVLAETTETEPHRWPSLQHSAAIRIT